MSMQQPTDDIQVVPPRDDSDRANAPRRDASGGSRHDDDATRSDEGSLPAPPNFKEPQVYEDYLNLEVAGSGLSFGRSALKGCVRDEAEYKVQSALRLNLLFILVELTWVQTH